MLELTARLVHRISFDFQKLAKITTSGIFVLRVVIMLFAFYIF